MFELVPIIAQNYTEIELAEDMRFATVLINGFVAISNAENPVVHTTAYIYHNNLDNDMAISKILSRYPQIPSLKYLTFVFDSYDKASMFCLEHKLSVV